MKEVTFNISGLHAEVVATHLLIVLEKALSGKQEGEIPKKDFEILTAIDQVYQKLLPLGESSDDEPPQPVSLTLTEAEAFLHAFTEDRFVQPAKPDHYYQRHPYALCFAQVYSGYLQKVSEAYTEALAA